MCASLADGELNVLEDLLTEAPDQDDELYNPETERAINDKKGNGTTEGIANGTDNDAGTAGDTDTAYLFTQVCSISTVRAELLPVTPQSGRSYYP